MSEQTLRQINWGELTVGRKYYASPACWNDETLYFLLLDRFSDGKETGGFKDAEGGAVTDPGGGRATPLFDPAVHAWKADRDAWFAAGQNWCGGTLAGLRDKLGYLKRLGVTAVWLSPVFKQVAKADTYHGYGIQNFLDVDPHFGTRDELRELVAAAHALGLRVILDIIFNHAGDVFAYQGNYPYYYHESRQWPVNGFRRDSKDAGTLPFGPIDLSAHPHAWPDGAVWPAELQVQDAWTRKGEIKDKHWDIYPEYLEGDFCALKDLSHGSASPGNCETWDLLCRIGQFHPSLTLQHLADAYKFWIAFADVDGFRVDTVKHVEPGAMRFFNNVIREFAQSLGKENFLLVGEVTGGRANAVATVDTTGLGAGLGIDDVQDKLEFLAKGWRSPGNPDTEEQEGYFDLFRNSVQESKPTHQWFGRHVVTMFDDHDQVGTKFKFRFCGSNPGGDGALPVALCINLLTAGIPCLYYGTEQAFDGADKRPYTDDPIAFSDVYLRECMFGGPFGSFQSQGAHFFNEEGRHYKLIGELCALRRDYLALRRGRQYLRQVSANGLDFFYPQPVADNLHYLVAWSRLFTDQECLCVVNTDLTKALPAWVTVDASLHAVGSTMRLVFEAGGPAAAAQVTVAARNGAAVPLTVPAGGCVVYV